MYMTQYLPAPSRGNRTRLNVLGMACRFGLLEEMRPVTAAVWSLNIDTGYYESSGLPSEETSVTDSKSRLPSGFHDTVHDVMSDAGDEGGVRLVEVTVLQDQTRQGVNLHQGPQLTTETRTLMLMKRGLGDVPLN